MPTEIIKVRITAEGPDSWYRGRIGETLEVYVKPNLTGNMYRLTDGSGNKIYIRNCRITNLQEQYPTLVETYK